MELRLNNVLEPKIARNIFLGSSSSGRAFGHAQSEAMYNCMEHRKEEKIKIETRTTTTMTGLNEMRTIYFPRTFDIWSLFIMILFRYAAIGIEMDGLVGVCVCARRVASCVCSWTRTHQLFRFSLSHCGLMYVGKQHNNKYSEFTDSLFIIFDTPKKYLLSSHLDLTLFIVLCVNCARHSKDLLWLFFFLSIQLTRIEERNVKENPLLMIEIGLEHH